MKHGRVGVAEKVFGLERPADHGCGADGDRGAVQGDKVVARWRDLGRVVAKSVDGVGEDTGSRKVKGAGIVVRVFCIV